ELLVVTCLTFRRRPRRLRRKVELPPLAIAPLGQRTASAALECRSCSPAATARSDSQSPQRLTRTKNGATSFKQAPLRCAAPCQFQARATWRPLRYRCPSQAAFVPFVSRAVDLRPAELHALSDVAFASGFIRWRLIVRSNSAKAPVSWRRTSLSS